MRWIIKYGYCLMLTIFLGSSIVLAFSMTDEEYLCFYIENDEKKEKIEVYTLEDGISYVFLPSYAKMEQLTVAFPNDQTFFVGGIELQAGANCRDFCLNQKYEVQFGEKTGVIQFCQSSDIPTLYINTCSGSMAAIYADKEYKEQASVTLYSADGDIEYTDKNCFVKGRGNSTWDKSKKPFLLRLSDEVGLLGMGEAKNWILLANAYDQSHLHNKVILDMADRVCENWTPQCKYVDVYLNGLYNGLYLLTEKIEIGKNRLDINTGAGDFLCTVDFSVRTETLENPFCTENGRTIAICEPNILSGENKTRIMELVNQQERILMSEKDLTQVQLVDIDSWIRKYLVDEIAGNTDADLSSSYFYYSDGVFYGGPVWDFDMGLGSIIQNHYPKAFIAKNYRKYDQFESVYYNALLHNESFVKRMREIYRDEFLPVLTQMIDHDIRLTAEGIATAINMDRIRWPVHVNEHPETDPWGRYLNTPEKITQYLRGKKELLSDVLIDEIPYCTLQFEHGGYGTYYWTVSVPRGAVLSETDVVNEPLFAEVHSVIWCIDGTEEIFDPDKPILEDMVLSRNEIDE